VQNRGGESFEKGAGMIWPIEEIWQWLAPVSYERWLEKYNQRIEEYNAQVDEHNARIDREQ
jgi:uncharacterized protein YukE